MKLETILARLREAFETENYELAEQQRDHLNDMIRFQRVASRIRRERRAHKVAS